MNVIYYQKPRNISRSYYH